MAKRKKSKRRKSSSSSTPRRNKRAFVGDKILATYQFISSMGIILILSLLASIGLGLTYVAEAKQQILTNIRDAEVHKFVENLNPTIGIGIFVAAGFLLIFGLAFVCSTWTGKKWAMWLHFILSAPSAVWTINLGLSNSDPRTYIGAVIGIAIALYSLLRIIGAVGPKL